MGLSRRCGRRSLCLLAKIQEVELDELFFFRVFGCQVSVLVTNSVSNQYNYTIRSLRIRNLFHTQVVIIRLRMV